jgi:thiol:disulfide interchange protein
MADNYARQRQYIDEQLKANPGNKDLLNAREMIDYREKGTLPSRGAEPDAAKMKANAKAASFQGEMTPEAKASMDAEYKTRTAATNARRAAAKAVTDDVARRAVRDAAGAVAKGAGTVARVLGGPELALYTALVPLHKSPEMKSLQALQEAAKKVY